MITKRLTHALDRLRAGGMGEHSVRDGRCAAWCAPCAAFAVFAVETQEDWRQMALSLLRRYKVPEHVVAPEELVQDLLLHASAFATDRAIKPGYPPKKYDPKRSPLAPYVVYNANAYVKKILHKRRGARMHDPSHEPSRIPRLFSSYGEEPDDSSGAVDRLFATMGLCEPPKQARLTELKSTVRSIVESCEDEAEGRVLEVLLAGESFDEGAAMLYADQDIRFAFELNSEEAAHALARGVLELVSEWAVPRGGRG